MSCRKCNCLLTFAAAAQDVPGLTWLQVLFLLKFSMMEGASTSLKRLHEQINACQICFGKVIDIKKPLSMDRGEPGRIMVVGQGPGNSEIARERAFSGQSGRRLDNWLKECGAAPFNPRAGIYLTSVLKCAADKRYFKTMAHNCRPFLIHQLTIVRPELVITLGEEAFAELRFDDIPYNDALCREFRSRDYLLMTAVDFHYTLLPWPHPSGLNRWHNNRENFNSLKASFNIVRQYMTRT